MIAPQEVADQQFSFQTKTSQMLSLDEANRVAFNYLTFEVNRYVLNLKREQALGLGISNEFYDKMQKDVRETNQFLSAYILNSERFRLTV
jgi:hypothetical protein